MSPAPQTRDKLLIVGAGPVGLGMAAALARKGLAYEHVDAGYGLGGNWRHGMHDGVYIVSSKRATAFADCPMPEDYPDFPNREQMLRYLEAYAQDRRVAERIEYDKTVVRAHPLPDDSWRVVFAGGEERLYKGLVVCIGHHWHKRFPSYPGAFAGELLHSKDYRHPGQIAGKRVLVIGAGNSACDIACEAARLSACCHLSLRRGYWFLPKTVFGKPLTDLPIWGLPVWMQRLMLRALIRITIGDYRKYGLARPDHRLFERHPSYGSELLAYIRQGRVLPRPEIARLDGHTVHFKDGTSGDYDVIVAATGFCNSIPFLPKGLVEADGQLVKIYAGAFPHAAKNLYIVGTEQPRTGFGAILTPAAELYAELIRMQDELEHPIGYILKWAGEDLPSSNLLDSRQALRRIRFSWWLLPLLRLQAWRLARHERHVPFAADTPFEFEEGPDPLGIERRPIARLAEGQAGSRRSEEVTGAKPVSRPRAAQKREARNGVSVLALRH
jgi:hypothetical protein